MRWGVGSAILIAALVLSGCPPGNELRTSGQAREFLIGVIHGSEAGDWTLKDDAVALAERVWLDRSMIEGVSTTLRDHGGEWACLVADQADTARDVLEGVKSPQAELKRVGILIEGARRGASKAEADALVDEVLQLTPFEALKTLDAFCDL
jgi:hypothetical protein